MSEIKSFWLLSIIFCVVYSTGSDNFSERSCRTSVGRFGVCKHLDFCNHVSQLRKKMGRSSPRFQQYLKNNVCGLQYSNSMICCPAIVVKKPKYDIIVHQKPSSTKLKKPNQNTISVGSKKEKNHTNIEKQSLLPEKCGTTYSLKVLGGVTTQLNEFPWLALLEYKKSSELILGCGGSLITKRYVLTAGHCVSSIPENWQLKRVRLGEYDTKSELDCEPEGADGLKCSDHVLILPIEQEIVHDSFWKTKDYANDIALLRLSQDVKFTDYIQPICINETPDLGDNYVAAGWGQTEYKSQSSVKLKVSLPRFNFNECKRIYALRGITLTDGQLCAGGESKKDTCAGDSGGPLMRMVRGAWVVDGIVSMGLRPCGQRGVPTVYTKVFHYLPWIFSKLQP